MRIDDMLDDLDRELPSSIDRDARAIERTRVSRAIDRALAPRVTKRPRPRTWMLMAAALLVAGAAAAALHETHTSVPTVTKPVEAPQPVLVAAPPLPAVEATIAIEDLPSAPETKIERAAAPQESAAEMFARANRSRQSGQIDGAIATYRQLEQRYPSSNEANVAHVSLGRALLDRDPKGALVELDRYLAGPNHDLREEALTLRARALGSLGRRDDERAAWQTLLSEHPDSLYAPRAKERIDALR
jgi:TolA-binding protein